MTRHSGGDQTTRRTTFRNVKVVTKKCRRSRCPNRFVIATRGRRRKYCSTACRMAAYRARQRVRVEHRSGNDEWGTPRDLFDHLDERYGPFTVDAAASDANHLYAGSGRERTTAWHKAGRARSSGATLPIVRLASGSRRRGKNVSTR